MYFRQWIRALLLVSLVVLVAACGQSADSKAKGEKADGQGDAPTQADSDHGQSELKEGQTNGHDAHADKSDKQARGADHSQHARRVRLDKQQREHLNLEVAKAEAGSANAMIQASATVRFDADRVARVGPRLEAKVVEVVADLGDRVEAGETVAVLESVELGRAKAQYLTARARFNAASAQYQRDQKLAEQQIASEADLLESRAAYQQAKAKRDAARAELRLYGMSESDIESVAVGGSQPLSRYALTAPMEGIVQKRDLAPGETVSGAQTPIHIVNNKNMWVMIEAYEKALPRLATGQQVTLNLRAFPDKSFTGVTDWVSRDLDEQSRTVRVRATVPNEKGLLRAGMFGTAHIQTKSEQRFALVPVDAVQTINDKQMVFVPGEQSSAFQAVTVKTGAESGGQIEVRQGLQPGERVVIKGAFDLKSAYTASGRSAAHSH
ncbi:efflux RND transporter periplasmic adaptor subunit [Salinisphaera sp. USBA-960]|nr:efflux RND transporter periplasmic adaptor subunit [Salifodinibacter halophilus]NNC27218.1 efflux RND transporter periplasmic adaptor subunit [Salifodinibacter halophilus]